MSGVLLPGRAALLPVLERGARTLQVDLPAGSAERLLDYLGLLLTWNRAYNLTAITDPPRMVTHHLLDSLSIAPHLDGRRVLDIGSGAGLPGIPLALCFPTREFHLLDSNGKKTRFLFQAALTLQLHNVTVHQMRAEDFRDAKGFDNVLARAVAALPALCASAGHLLAPEGSLLAMKAEPDDAELQSVRPPYNVAACVDLDVPGIDRPRRLVRIDRRPEPRSDGSQPA